jgi:hypothetical protein
MNGDIDYRVPVRELSRSERLSPEFNNSHIIHLRTLYSTLCSSTSMPSLRYSSESRLYFHSSAFSRTVTLILIILNVM